jgi:hypothetical protein
VADAERQTGKGSTSQDVPWMTILSVAASIAGVLAFLGIANLGQLRHTLFPPSASPITTPSSHVPGPEPDTATSTPFDPRSLNSSVADKTPFTEGALLPQRFTNDLAVRYRLVAWGERGCTQAYAMDPGVQEVLRTHGCTTVMTGEYLVDSTTVNGNTIVNGNTQVLVSVQIFAMNNLSTAAQVVGDFPNRGTWDFGIWCPTLGPGSNACTSGYATARKHEGLVYDHRYVIEATAVYTNLTPNAVVTPWVHAAARRAIAASGPENYWGNH